MSEWSPREDADLVAACLDGKEEAWEALLVRYDRLIYTIIRRTGISAPVADEIYQEICLILLQKLHTLADRQRLRTWLVTVTRRACLQYLRRRESTTPIHSSEAHELIDHRLEQQITAVEQQDLIRQALTNLDECCRRLLEALFLEATEPSYETIAANLAMPVNSIGPNRIRCLEKLRTAILQLEERV